MLSDEAHVIFHTLLLNIFVLESVVVKRMMFFLSSTGLWFGFKLKFIITFDRLNTLEEQEVI